MSNGFTAKDGREGDNEQRQRIVCRCRNGEWKERQGGVIGGPHCHEQPRTQYYPRERPRQEAVARYKKERPNQQDRKRKKRTD
ncbi:MAG: hypothetical protein ACTSRN_04945, partial [Alphaproteobacteria bacterium]